MQPGAVPTLMRSRSSGASAGIGQPVGQRRVDDDGRGAALARDVGQPRPLFAHAHRHRDRAQPLQRQQHGDELGPVVDEHHDAVAAADAARGQAGGQPGGGSRRIRA